MKRFARALAVTFGLVVLSSFVLLVPQKNASGTTGGAPVTVTNAPLPVTGNVNAAVSGTVGLAPNTTVGITGNALVVNPLDAFSNPIPLISRDTDNAARQPFVGQCTLGILNPRVSNCLSGFGEITVPNGKRLVIEYVSAELFLTGTGKAYLLAVSYTSGGQIAEADFVPQDTGASASGIQEVSVVGALTRLYADPGSKIDCQAVSTDGSSFFSGDSGTCKISGFLFSP
jgi:hypothetical protein